MEEKYQPHEIINGKIAYGFRITEKILQDKRLTRSDMMLLSLIRNYTLFYEEHCCDITNDDIMKYLHMKRATFFRAKKHLKELGLINIDGDKIKYIEEN